jgi:hypothetical protein
MTYPYLAPTQAYNPYGAAAANPYDQYSAYNPYGGGYQQQQAPNPYMQQAPAYPMAQPGYPSAFPAAPALPPMPPAPDLNMGMPNLDKFIPSPEAALPAATAAAMAPATSELPPGGKPQAAQKKKSSFPKIIGWLVGLGVLYWAGKKFLGKKGDAAQDEALGNSPLNDSAKTFLSGVNKDDVNEKTLKQFEDHLSKANKTLNEDEKYSESDLKPEMTRLLQGFAEGDDEKLKDVAQALLDKKEGASSTPAEPKVEPKIELPTPSPAAAATNTNGTKPEEKEKKPA